MEKYRRFGTRVMKNGSVAVHIRQVTAYGRFSTTKGNPILIIFEKHERAEEEAKKLADALQNTFDTFMDERNG